MQENHNHQEDEEKEKTGIVHELIEPLIDRATDYGKTNLQLVKLKAVKQVARILPALVTKLVMVMLLVFFILMLSIGAAIWIGELLGKTYYGFLVIAGFYALLLLLFQTVIKKGLTKSLGNRIVSEILQ